MSYPFHPIHISTRRTGKEEGQASYVVTCSCGHHVATTDSRTAASRYGTEHQETPECPMCHHRNVHNATVGCLYAPSPSLSDAELIAASCHCGAATGGVAQGEVYQVGEADACIMPLGELTCNVCGHAEHGDSSCTAVLSVGEALSTRYYTGSDEKGLIKESGLLYCACRP